MPLTPCPAPGVAAGVAGITPLPDAAALAPDCSPLTKPFAPLFCCDPSFSDGGVRSPAPPGNDRDAGEVKALACCAVDGCELSESMLTGFEVAMCDDCGAEVGSANIEAMIVEEVTVWRRVEFYGNYGV